ncbi:Secreted protein [Psilocybe cubensis]|uniref:Calcineurin-like phosphoesterase domain-containing protein n=2 Tax=Psilocybe cubensis TaxID=181762 RepID=A0A8H7Y3Q8_PSICU|nr:Secreted protein [Psilocybe cubensis]KAH9485630.1 Secreted protein [Psilocybe cubensis]
MLLLTPSFVLGLLGSLAAVSTTSACEDGHAHDHAKRTTPSVQLTPPTRQLEWGDINIIHTTDSHGWLLGHQKSSFPEPNYSGTFGDFASFVTHMKELAIERDTDLLLVDSGDLHDGTGLTDGFPAGGIDAHDANQFIKQLPYDIMAIGNHELYIYANALDMHQNFAPSLKGRYLSSNVNITVLNEKGQVVSVPVGERFAKFKTRKGRKVTSLGVLFDFTGNDHNTKVQKVSDMVKETWFAEAIKEEPDFFLLVGHMPIARDDWPLVFNAVRAVHPTTPILILGGHTHIRDCLQLDGRSMSLESGRYMETIGWLSAKLDKKGSKKNITFSRRYLDPNRVTFEFHTRKNSFNFDTLQGESITKGLNNLAKKFDLSFQFGTAPHDFTISQAPFPSNDSLLSLFIENAVPVALAINNTRASIPNIMITNSGSQRFDIYAGPFTKNDQLTASPFDDSFLFIPNVPFSIANKVLPALNEAGANERRELLEERERELYGRGHVDMVYNRWLEEQDRRSGIERRAAQNLTLGYVTSDACPGVGDDVLHAPLPFFPTPDFIGSVPPTVADDAPIDLVFVDFIETQLLQILNSVQSDKTFTTADVSLYSPILATQAAAGHIFGCVWPILGYNKTPYIEHEAEAK